MIILPIRYINALKNSTTTRRRMILVNEISSANYNRNTAPQHIIETSEQNQAKTSAVSKKVFKQVRMQSLFKNGDFLTVSIIISLQYILVDAFSMASNRIKTHEKGK